jgi:hypothetical protein
MLAQRLPWAIAWASFVSILCFIAQPPIWTKELREKVCILDFDNRDVFWPNHVWNNGHFHYDRLEGSHAGVLNHYLYGKHSRHPHLHLPQNMFGFDLYPASVLHKVPSSGVRIAWSTSATLAYAFVEYTVVSSGVTDR